MPTAPTRTQGQPHQHFKSQREREREVHQIHYCTLCFYYLPYVYKKIIFVSHVNLLFCISVDQPPPLESSSSSTTIMSSSSSTLCSQCLVLATAMAVSAGTIILFDLVRDKYFPASDHFSRDHQDFPRSCLSSGSLLYTYSIL